MPTIDKIHSSISTRLDQFSSQNQKSSTEIPSVLVPTEDGPVIFLLGEQYDEFARIYDQRRDKNPIVEDEDDMEDVKKTTVSEYERVCLERWLEVREAELENGMISHQELQYWEWERNTWNLIGKLFGLRYTSSSDDVLQTHPYSSDSAQLRAQIQSSPRLQEALLVKQWLEDVKGDFTPVEIRRGYLPYTSRRLNQVKRVEDGLVTNIDPDAPTRTHKNLDNNDQDYENQLMVTLFNYIRRGMIVDAVELCKQVDQPWRAASLWGGLLKSDSVMDNDDAWSGTEAFSGNSNRGLWKEMCRKIAMDEMALPHERALYATLCGDWKHALEVCHEWEDELWILYVALAEEISESCLENVPHVVDGLQEQKTGERLTPLAIFDQLERSIKPEIRQACQVPFHFIQKMIILNRVGELIHHVRSELETAKTSPDKPSPFRHPHVLRFMVHFVLLLRPLQQTSLEDGNFIIKCYVDTLVDCKKSAIVAPYAAELPVTDRTDSYSSLLSNINPSTHVKKDYLNKAQNYGMDTGSIAWQAVEKAFNRGIRSEPLKPASQVHILWNEPPSASDLSQIRSLEWLTMVPDQLDTALFATNFLLRRFMLHGRILAASEIQRQIPGDFIPAEVLDMALEDVTPEDARLTGRLTLVKEHLGLLSVLNALEAYNDWVKQRLRKPLAPTSNIMPRTTQRAHDLELGTWREEMRLATDKAVQASQSVINARWITSEIDELEASGEVSEELKLFRDVYLPEIVMDLQYVLFASSDVIPENLQKSIDIAQEVADEEKGIYKVMQRGGRLSEFLDKVRVSGLTNLERSANTDPFGSKSSAIMQLD